MIRLGLMKYTCVAIRSIGEYRRDDISMECMRNSTISEKQRESSGGFHKSTRFVHSRKLQSSEGGKEKQGVSRTLHIMRERGVTEVEVAVVEGGMI